MLLARVLMALMVLSGFPLSTDRLRTTTVSFQSVVPWGFLQAMACSSVEPFEKVVKSGFFTPELSFN